MKPNYDYFIIKTFIQMNFTKILAKKSIKYNISVLLGATSIILIVGIIGYSIFKLREVEINSSISNAQSLTANYAGKIKSELDEAVQASEIFSSSFSSIKEPDSTLKLNREQANAILKQTLIKKKNLLGTWTLWEPNAFDNNDSAFINKNGHDATGRFIPYWVRGEDGSVSVSPLTGYTEMATGDWYLIPKETKTQFVHTLTYPADGKNVTMLTVVTPVEYNNVFYGVTGADISLDWLQTYVEKMQKEIFEGKSVISISTQEGKIAALTGSSDKIGLRADSVLSSHKNIFDKSESGYLIHNDTLIAYAPLILGQDNAKWQVSISVPFSVITANAWKQFYIFLTIGIIFLFIRTRIESFLINKLTKPIVEIAHAAENIAVGDLKYDKVDITSTELGILDTAFSKLVKSQQHITDVCVGISEGDFTLQAEIKSDSDTLGISVNKMISNLKKSADEDAKRNWSSEGLAKFADILRSNNDLKILSNTIISNLIKYVNANQGAIFILNDDSKSHYLELLACYAYDRQKYLNKTIEIGEGLAGQCFQEKSRIYLTEVPDSYINITSGLGYAPPRNVLIVPLLNNDKVEGVIEIASFNTLEEYQMQFIEKVAESIASTISNMKINQQTTKLLSETQAQSAQMHSQEEEMRQNLEEMTAIQEEMQRKEFEYLDKIEKLEKEVDSLKK